MKRAREILQIVGLRNALTKFIEKSEKMFAKWEPQSKRLHNARTNIMPVKLNNGSYVIICLNRARKYEHGSAWIGQMRIVNTKCERVFVVEDILRTEKLTEHAQRLKA